MGFRHSDAKPSGNHYIVLNDGIPLAPTPRRKSGHPFSKSYAPGKLAPAPDAIKKSRRPLPSDPRYDPTDPRHAPYTHAAMSQTATGPQLRHGDVVWFIRGDILYHAKVKGLSQTHALVVGHEGEHVVPRAQLHRGFHPDAKRPGTREPGEQPREPGEQPHEP